MRFLKTSGSSLLEVIVGSAILLIVFVGFLGVLKMGTKLVYTNKARAGAVALANEQMEYIRSLKYDDIGTVGGIPSGNLPQTESLSLNNINYIRRTFIKYVDAPQDGTGDDDENSITADYKQVRVSVSWDNEHPKSVFLLSNFAPAHIESLAGGGSLVISAFDSKVQPIAGASVHIENSSTTPPIDVETFTNNQGKVIFPGSPQASSYKITVTKNGFSTDKTYDATPENQNPNPGHLTVVAGQTTSKDFFIDKFGSVALYIYKDIKTILWEDLFDNQDKISSLASTTISSGNIVLDSDYLSGSVISNLIEPTYPNQWIEASWQDDTPGNSQIKYHIYDQDFNLVPETDLPGNSTGFSTSPLDISSLNVSNYPKLALGAELSRATTTENPQINLWQIKYKNGPEPFDGAHFSIHGEKTIGDNNGSPVYKYSTSKQVDSNGFFNFDQLEWDKYHITLNESNWDIAYSCSSLPFQLNPDAQIEEKIYTQEHTTNTLNVLVKNSVGDIIEGAEVTLSRTGFNESKNSNLCGQTFFNSLQKHNDYVLSVTKSGYSDYSESNVDVDGQSKTTVILTQ